MPLDYSVHSRHTHPTRRYSAKRPMDNVTVSPDNSVPASLRATKRASYGSGSGSAGSSAYKNNLASCHHDNTSHTSCSAHTRTLSCLLSHSVTQSLPLHPTPRAHTRIRCTVTGTQCQGGYQRRSYIGDGFVVVVHDGPARRQLVHHLPDAPVLVRAQEQGRPAAGNTQPHARTTNTAG